MADSERPVIHRGVCVIRTQAVSEVLESGRRMFRALAPCPLWGEPDERPGIEVHLHRRAVIFSRWQIALPDKRVFLTRTMMGL